MTPRVKKINVGMATFILLSSWRYENNEELLNTLDFFHIIRTKMIKISSHITALTMIAYYMQKSCHTRGNEKSNWTYLYKCYVMGRF
jgi:hypothetical protein